MAGLSGDGCLTMEGVLEPDEVWEGRGTGSVGCWVGGLEDCGHLSCEDILVVMENQERERTHSAGWCICAGCR